MIVKVKYTNELARELYHNASGNESQFPFKKYNEDFCYDVVATSCTEIAPNVYKYGIGLAFQIDRGAEYAISPTKLSIDLRPRSSVWKTGMVLSNSVGTIDETYTGEVSAIFYHLFPDMPIYKVGERIGQIKIGTTFPIDFVEVDDLDSTMRGAGGFGSTGK
jgi:dUTP pyrophosphatase